MTFNDTVGGGEEPPSQKAGLWEPGNVQPLHRWATLPLSLFHSLPPKGWQSRDDAFQHLLAAPVLWRRAALCGSLLVFFPPRTLKATVWGDLYTSSSNIQSVTQGGTRRKRRDGLNPSDAGRFTHRCSPDVHPCGAPLSIIHQHNRPATPSICVLEEVWK